jgi:hypothetical protein
MPTQTLERVITVTTPAQCPAEAEHNKLSVASAGEYGYFRLHPAYPNPFNPETIISYSLPAASNVSLKIYNSLGEEVRTLVKGFQPEGHYTLPWNGKDSEGRDMSSGAYLARIQAGVLSSNQKLLLMR